MEVSTLCKVAKCLWFGGQDTLDLVDSPYMGITHVLSIVNYEVQLPEGSVQQLHVLLEDDEDSNLLQQLPACIDFIGGALQGGGNVLVHCNAGASRSAAVTIAYIMASRQMGIEQVLQVIQQKNPRARPNDGFIEQLTLFEQMGCKLDADNADYRRFCMQQIGKRWEEGGWVDPSEMAALPEDGADLSSTTLYRCRKCRRLLATSRNVVPLTNASGRAAFMDRRSVKGNTLATDEAADSSVFLEPMQWMADEVTGAVQGKLYCPGCSARLGSFNWSGITNSSGAWVTPAFQLHLSKMDAMEPQPLVQIRRPLVGPAAAAPAAPAATPPGPSSTAAAAAAAAEAPAHAPPAPAAAAAAAAVAAAPPAAAVAANPPATPAVWPDVAPSAGDQREQPQQPQQPQQQQQQQQQQQPQQQPQQCGTAWFTHLVFDNDGVLVDSERASCEALRRAVLEVTGQDVPHSFPHDFYGVFGMDVRGCVEYYKQRLGREDWVDTQRLAERVQVVKERHYQELTAAGVSPFAGAAELIARVRQLGVGLGVGSSGAPGKISHNLRSSGLLQHLQPEVDSGCVVSAAYVNRGKPAPDVYVETLRRMGCSDPSRAMVVEDAVHGLNAARSAGAFAVAVTTSLPREALEPYADIVVESLAEVAPLLESLVPAGATAAAAQGG